MGKIVTGKTKLYAVIGDPISHSLSPQIHNRLFAELKTDRMYVSLRIPSEELKSSVELLRNNFHGFNVTIPHKEAIIPLLDELDERAKIYGAVNTVKIEKGRLKGYNTDGYGFIKSLDSLDLKYHNKKALVLGAGGAARVIAYELVLKGCIVTIANRSEGKALCIKGDIERATGIEINVISLSDVQDKYDFIVNTTPVGMSAMADRMPVGEHVLNKAELVYDLIYNPSPTKLLKMAERYNCRTEDGFSMLFYQAVKAQEIWLENSIKKSIISSVLSAMMVGD
ncbi:shikimate dehydrogenase [Alkaliphilus transvaalensis]|uniref:shikimate dehydrogenase n=1 Tax=Alkaliphilus transvaalensis TaxID=114628 RepID=UPI000688B012|nr:shikimate dehydrogenase [Alkaliphilus transvaalensis]